MSRRRIVIVAPGFAATADEPGLAAVLDLVARLAERHHVRVIALRHPTPAGRYAVAGVPIRSLGLRAAKGPLGRARVLAAGVAGVIGAHRQRPIDVVHALWADEPGAVAVGAAALLRRPAVVSVMGGELVALADIGYGAALGRGGRWTVRAALRFARAVTVGSSYLRRQVIARVPANRVRLAPLGVDTALFTPPPTAPPVPPTVLFVGGLSPVKDPLAALRAFSAVAAERPTARLAFVGDGPLRPALEEEARRRGVAGRVDFHGQLPRRELLGVYRAASVLCVTSRHEAQSVATVEAAACGLPIVGFRVGVLEDLTDTGAASVEIGDEHALARELGRVLEDAVARREMGAAGRAAAEREFEIDRATARFLSLYEELLGS